MNFAETLRGEVVQSRQSRGRTARFLGRMIGFVLVLTTMATMQAHPDLRRALIDAGMRGVGKVMGLSPPPPESAEVPEADMVRTGLPRSRVPVSRAGARDAN